MTEPLDPTRERDIRRRVHAKFKTANRELVQLRHQLAVAELEKAYYKSRMESAVKLSDMALKSLSDPDVCFHEEEFAEARSDERATVVATLYRWAAETAYPVDAGSQWRVSALWSAATSLVRECLPADQEKIADQYPSDPTLLNNFLQRIKGQSSSKATDELPVP